MKKIILAALLTVSALAYGAGYKTKWNNTNPETVKTMWTVRNHIKAEDFTLTPVREAWTARNLSNIALYYASNEETWQAVESFTENGRTYLQLVNFVERDGRKQVGSAEVFEVFVEKK